MVSTAPKSHSIDSRQEPTAELGGIASRMAHEIRNPLNAIRMQVAVIRNKITQPSPENLRVATSQLERLEQEVLRVEKLAKAFLDFGRPPADQLEDVDLSELAESVAAVVRPAFEGRGLTLSLEGLPRGETWVVRADRAKLGQVLLNLLGNASNAIEGHGRVTLTVRRHAVREVAIEVRDTGGGIAPAIMPQIFMPFFSGRGDGMGLGLAVAKRTVEDAGGFVMVESTPGEGSCFRVVLPVKSEG